jgi:aspartate aminotransferase-like enzyme
MKGKVKKKIFRIGHLSVYFRSFAASSETQ